jgi:hypothetical protein
MEKRGYSDNGRKMKISKAKQNVVMLDYGTLITKYTSRRLRIAP